MNSFNTYIHNIPALILGEKSNKVYLFVHGRCGNKEEAIPFAEIATKSGYQVLSIDLPGHGVRKESGDELTPLTAVPELRKVYSYLFSHYKSISLRANSIGAYFSYLAFGDKKIDNSLLVSPIVDMVKLIENMMTWANVTKEQLEREKIINTSFGQPLSWDYYQFALNNKFSVPENTHILYAGRDNLTSRETIENFAKIHGSTLTVLEDGEHWFHTESQLEALKAFEEKYI